MSEPKRNIPVFTKTDLTVGAVFGEGGFGSVYVAKLKKLHQQVAVKVFKTNYGESISERHRDMLMKEANHMFDARHPNVVHIFGIVLETDYYAIVMDFCPTGSVKKLLQHCPDTSISLRNRILYQVAIAMNFLHQMDPVILHLDLKAANVLLDTYCNVKLCDFGLSKARKEITSASVTSKGLHGTVTHMSPQQLKNSDRPTKQDDVYSYGILIWEVFTSGMQPYEDKPHHEILVGVVILNVRPKTEFLIDTRKHLHLEELYKMMKRCYTHNPSERPTFDECAEFMEDIINTDGGNLQGDAEKVTKKVQALEQEGNYMKSSKLKCKDLTEAVDRTRHSSIIHLGENEAKLEKEATRSRHKSNLPIHRSTTHERQNESERRVGATRNFNSIIVNSLLFILISIGTSMFIGGYVSKPNETLKCAEKAEIKINNDSGMFRYKSREGWGARPRTDPPTLLKTPTPYVIITHTAGLDCVEMTDCCQSVVETQNLHMDVRGWSDIGYNFLIGNYGVVYEGRGWTVEGAHTLRWNNRSVGIAFIGDFRLRRPDDKALQALEEILHYGVVQNYLMSNYTMYGHCQLRPVMSPGEKLYNELMTWPHWRFRDVSEDSELDGNRTQYCLDKKFTPPR